MSPRRLKQWQKGNAAPRVHRRDQQEVAGIGARAADPHDRHPFFLDRLSDSLQDVPTELGKLVQEQDAAMRERDLAGRRADAAAHETRS